MRAPGKARGQILILLATWLFFGGGASSALVVYERPVSEMKQRVKRAIADEARKEAILADIGRWESLQKQHNKQVNQQREELFKALRLKDTPRSKLEPIMAELDKTFLVMDWDFLNLRFAVTKQVTRSEWSQIVPQCRFATSSACDRVGAL